MTHELKPTAAHKCTYCGASHETRATMTERKIIQRDNRAYHGIRTSMLWFCKDKSCGGYYQMGCEG